MGFRWACRNQIFQFPHGTIFGPEMFFWTQLASNTMILGFSARTETGQNVWRWGECLKSEEAGACASFDDTASFTGLSMHFGNPSPMGKYIQEKTIVSDILVSVNIVESSKMDKGNFLLQSNQQGE